MLHLKYIASNVSPKENNTNCSNDCDNKGPLRDKNVTTLTSSAIAGEIGIETNETAACHSHFRVIDIVTT